MEGKDEGDDSNKELSLRFLLDPEQEHRLVGIGSDLFGSSSGIVYRSSLNLRLGWTGIHGYRCFCSSSSHGERKMERVGTDRDRDGERKGDGKIKNHRI